MKRILLAIVFFGIFTAIFSAIFFIFVENYTPTRWISYGIIHLTGVLLVLNLYSFPQVKGGVIFGYAKRELAFSIFFTELILGTIFIIINNDNYIIPLLIQASILGVNFAQYIILVTAELHSKRLDAQDQQNIAFIKEASIILQSSVKHCEDWKLAKKMETLLDAVKSSQIKYLPEIAGMEQDFLKIINEISQKVIAGETDSIEPLLKQGTILLEQRNNLIKIKR